MNFDLQRVLASKRAYRQKLAARPIAEKLELLDQLRARALVIQRATAATRNPGVVMEPPASARSKPAANKAILT